MATTATSSGREQVLGRQLLDALKKAVPISQGLIVSTLPRGDLQVVQPANVAESLVRAYAGGFHAEDVATWHAIIKQKTVRATDCWSNTAFHQTPYYQNFMVNAGLRYVAIAPLHDPILPGYPGAIHLLRTEDQGEFSDAELRKITDLVNKLRPAQPAKGSKRAAASQPRLAGFERPSLYLVILNEKLQQQLPGSWNALDDDLRDSIAEHARRKLHALNGHAFTADRVQIADSQGDHWVFRQVNYRRYPALGNGSYSFFCLQPECYEWSAVRASDFGADPELSRLIPAVRFMEEEYSRGPGLTEIARTVDLSPFHFHRRFTELLGLTPKQFMLNCQIFHAKSELVAGTKELIQIAKDCGFAHQSHFTSRFKQATGLTPTRWRRMARQRAAAR